MAKESIITVFRSTSTDTPTGLTFGELAYSDLNGKLFVGKNDGTSMWVGAGITSGSLSTNSAYLVPTQSAVKAYVDASTPTDVVTSVNGATGAITNVAKTNVAQNFTATQSFSGGLTATGATFFSDIEVNGGIRVGLGAGNQSSNVVVGDAFVSNVDGYSNTVVGLFCLYGATAANNNSILGSTVLNSAQGNNAEFNVAIGNNILTDAIVSRYNIAIGHNAGRYVGTGSSSNTLSYGNVLIGNDVRTLSDDNVNSIVIGGTLFEGPLTVGDGSNTTVIGNSSTISTRVFGLLSTNGGLSAAGATFSGNVSAPNLVYSVAGIAGAVSITGTANEVTVTNDINTITIGLPDDVVITGNLTVNGTVVTNNVDTFIVEDPLIVLGTGNSGDSLDLGFYSKYTSGATKYSGLFRDATDGKYRLFTTLEEEPTTTVNTSGTGYATATLIARIDGGTF